MTLGFIPVTLDDIADGPEAEGQEVFTIGFPSSTALIGQGGLGVPLVHPQDKRFKVSLQHGLTLSHE